MKHKNTAQAVRARFRAASVHLEQNYYSFLALGLKRWLRVNQKSYQNPIALPFFVVNQGFAGVCCLRVFSKLHWQSFWSDAHAWDSADDSSDVDAIDLSDYSDNEEEKRLKIVLLGCGQVGKSTLFKQFQELFAPCQDRPIHYKPIIHNNVIASMQSLIRKGTSLEPSCDETVLSSQKTIDAWNRDQPLQEAEAKHVDLVWRDPTMQQAWALRDSYQIGDNLEYFANKIEELTAPGYVPSVLDQMQAEVRTMGVTKSEFTVLNRKVLLVDVGGQRSERRKWVHEYNEVDCVVFVVNLNGYNRMLWEDSTQNRLLEDLRCFENIINVPLFKNTPFCLIFNFRDLFKPKIESWQWDVHAGELSRYLPSPLIGLVRDYVAPLGAPLSALFPDYKGGADYEQALAFIREKFLQLDRRPQKLMTTMTTCMLDPGEARQCIHQIMSSVIPFFYLPWA